MAWIHPTAVEHRRKMFTRHDAWRFAPHSTPEGKMPGWLDPSMTRVRWKEAQEEEARAAFEAEVKAAQATQDRLCEMFAELKYELAWRNLLRKFSPDQPRVPAGNPDGGQWTSGNGGSQSHPAGGLADTGGDGQILSDASPDPIRPGSQYAQDTSRRYSVNLDEEEHPKGIGHTKRDHVGKSDAELIGKLDEDWQRIGTGRFEITKYRPAQGSFLSREAANDFVNRTLEDNKDRVDRSRAARRIVRHWKSASVM